MATDTPRLDKFCQLVVDLNVQWRMYDDLFSDDTHYDIFNKTGRNFWIRQRDYLLDGLFISISRFFDPPKSRGQENLSLAAVTEFSEVQEISASLKQRLSALTPKWEDGIKIWRNTMLSHHGMDTVLEKKILPEIQLTEVKELITGISEFAREINRKVNGYDRTYSDVIITQWVPELIEYLKLGIQKHRELYGETE